LESFLIPLGISFFIFQKIALLVDAYQGKIKKFDFQDYLLFVSFFPRLIAGPIVHYPDMQPQFDRAPWGSATAAPIGQSRPRSNITSERRRKTMPGARRPGHCRLIARLFVGELPANPPGTKPICRS